MSKDEKKKKRHKEVENSNYTGPDSNILTAVQLLSFAIMSGLASDEVAEDYKNSLEDLTTNDRFQISNLTVIAKENTEHAMAISRVLENHIRTVGAHALVLFFLFLFVLLLFLSL